MEIWTERGDFREFGCVLHEKRAVITYVTNPGEDSAVVLFDRRSHERIARIVPDPSSRIGRVVSISLTGPDWENTVYLLEENGIEMADPYSRRIYGRERWADLSRKNDRYRIYSGPLLKEDFLWNEERRESHREEADVMLRLHLRGFTMQTSLSEKKRGNYLGIMERLTNLREYGVTILEFQPLYEFEEFCLPRTSQNNHRLTEPDRMEDPKKVNFWGYGDGNYFAPKSSYFGGDSPDIHMKEMVRAIHREQMEIVMEMNFGENMGTEDILRCLRYWMEEYHIDGFRLIGGNLPMKEIASDPFLAGTKIYCDRIEGDLLEQETEKGRHLYIENPDFLYPLRKLQNHMDGSIQEFSNMMRRQNASYGFVNYAASSFGFTLLDAYSYSEKHNEPNGEDNHDGPNYNFSHNYGVEGPTNSRNVQKERLRHVRTALAAVLLAQGIPMIQAGDTCGNTQSGNNNAYCQDNPDGWVTFPRKKQFRLLHKYVGALIRFRREHPILGLPEPMQMSDYRHLGLPDLSYHGKEPWILWLTNDRKSLGILYNGDYGKYGREDDVFLCFNFYFEAEHFALPKLPGERNWYFVTNTADDTWPEQARRLETEDSVSVPGGSLTILIGKEEKEHAERSAVNISGKCEER